MSNSSLKITRYYTIALVLVGVALGVLDIYPSKLRFLPTMFLWGGVGIVIGFLARERKVLHLGSLYGFSLLVGFFLASLIVNFEALKRPVFDLFVVVVTPIAAIVAVFVGSVIAASIKRQRHI